jgi:hypothetical protein
MSQLYVGSIEDSTRVGSVVEVLSDERSQLVETTMLVLGSFTMVVAASMDDPVIIDVEIVATPIVDVTTAVCRVSTIPCVLNHL